MAGNGETDYRIQELAYGGLSARAEAKLRELIAEEEQRLRTGEVRHEETWRHLNCGRPRRRLWTT